MPQRYVQSHRADRHQRKSWEEAAKIAVERAAQHLRELRVAEVVEQDIVITDGKVEAYRTKLRSPSNMRGTTERISLRAPTRLIEQARHRLLFRGAGNCFAEQSRDRQDADIVARPSPTRSAGSSR